jgi:hypothetical protein
MTSYIYNGVSKMLVWRYKAGQYFSHIIPSHINFILRVDPVNGRVLDELNIRRHIVAEHYYYIGTWNRGKGQYETYYISGMILARDFCDEWATMYTRDFVRRMAELYKPVGKRGSLYTDILAITINGEDASHIFANIRESLAIPSNVTATALVLLYKYLKKDRSLPYYASFHSFAMDMLENSAHEFNIDSTDSNTQPIEWEGKLNKVTIVDFDLNEHSVVGDVFIN